MVFRPPGRYLIIRTSPEPEAAWDLPGGPVESQTMPELILRRCCQEQVGCDVHVVAGRPPVTTGSGPLETRWHVFLCTVLQDEALPIGCAELRWVTKADLREYQFAGDVQSVVDAWLMTE